ncbi:hypothetical protein F0562_017337 [Nyssa sinensis]|uniref:Uncharacterized protein n=1 Tax=Nyssa sinensis TaxID=561372 RepID=A0A5J4ZE02_9ASTE|nr:hypothetical protein F0562_017337 [Nyssa sinensis]
MDERVDYASWFAAHSIARIVDVSRFLGRLTVGSKVLTHWMSTHHPNMMLIPRSEYEAMAEARDAAIAESMKLQEELAWAKGHSEGETLTSSEAQSPIFSQENYLARKSFPGKIHLYHELHFSLLFLKLLQGVCA